MSQNLEPSAPEDSSPPLALQLLGPPVSVDDVDPEVLAQIAAVMMPKLDLPSDWRSMKLLSLRALVKTPFEPPWGYTEDMPSAFDIVGMEALRRARRLVDLAKGDGHAAVRKALQAKQEAAEKQAAAEDLLRKFNRQHPGEGDVLELDVVEYALCKKKGWPHEPNEAARLETWKDFQRHQAKVSRRKAGLPQVPVVFGDEPAPEGCSKPCRTTLGTGDYIRIPLNAITARENVPSFVLALRKHWLGHSADVVRAALREGGEQTGAIQKEKARPGRRQKRLEALEDAELDKSLTAAISRREEQNRTRPAKKE